MELPTSAVWAFLAFLLAFCAAISVSVFDDHSKRWWDVLATAFFSALIAFGVVCFIVRNGDAMRGSEFYYLGLAIFVGSIVGGFGRRIYGFLDDHATRILGVILLRFFRWLGVEGDTGDFYEDDEEDEDSGNRLRIPHHRDDGEDSADLDPESRDTGSGGELDLSD